MASFVEQATLVVKDQSSAPINKVNRALKELNATARSLKSVKIKLSIDDSDVKKASQSLRQLRVELRMLGNLSKNIKINAVTAGFGRASAAIKGMTRNVTALNNVSRATRVNVNTHAITLAQARLNALRASAAQPINVRTTGGRGGGLGGGGGGGGGLGGRRRGGALGQVSAGLARGLGLGVGMFGGIAALEVAAWAAAAAIKAMVESAQRRDRTQLQSNVQATEMQRKVFNELDKARGKQQTSPLPMTKDAYDRLRTSVLGDVGGDTEADRARAADKLTQYLQKDLYPRFFAQDPTKTPEEAQTGLRKIVQAVNLASADLTDATGEVTADAKRVFRGIQLALSADPEIPPTLVKSTLANLKTAGFSLSEDAIATVLMAAGNQGVRAGNETFRAIKALTGGTDVKVLNNALAKMGLLLDVQRNAKGNVIAGSGTPVDTKMLNQNPMEYLYKYVRPLMEADLKKQAEGRAAKIKGKGPEADAKRQQALAVQQDDRIAWITRSFAGMNAAAQNGIAQMMLTYDQNGRQLRQASAGLSQDVTDALKKSWTAQFENLKTALENKRAEMGDAAFKAMGLAEKLEYITKAVVDPMGAEGQKIGAITRTVAALTGNPLVIAGETLIRSGINLTSAAETQQTVMQRIAELFFGKETKADPTKLTPQEQILAPNQQQQTQTLKAIEDLGQQIQAAERRRALARSQGEIQKADAALAEMNARMTALNQTLATQQEQAKQLITADATRIAMARVEYPNWVTAAIDYAQQQPNRAPRKPIATAWEDTPEARRANIKAAAAAAEEARRRQKVPKEERRGAFGDPKQITPVSEITSFVTSMNQVSTTMGTALKTGGEDVAKGGQTAASVLTTAAPGIGALIGDRAAESIRAAVSNLNIKVTAQAVGGAVDTGGQRDRPAN